jgi:hypothetical protein
MFAQGFRELLGQLFQIVAAFLRLTLPEVLIVGGLGVGVWAAFIYSPIAGRCALALMMLMLGVSAAGRKGA